MISGAFERLREGDAFQTGARTVTDADVTCFDSLGPARAAEHLGGWAGPAEAARRVAPGMLTLAVSLALSEEHVSGAVALRGIADVAFTRPVAVGDALAVSGRIVELAELDARTGLVTFVLLTANQHGRTVCRARVQLLWRRAPASESDQ